VSWAAVHCQRRAKLDADQASRVLALLWKIAEGAELLEGVADRCKPVGLAEVGAGCTAAVADVK